MKKIIIAAFLVVILCISLSYARTKTNKITGVYSSLYYHEEAGDLLGEEAFIIYTKKGYYILFQQSEGGPEVPVLVPMKVENQHISFILPDTIIGYTGVFNGEIEKDHLIGTFIINGEVKNVKLKRKNSYWQ